LQKIPVERRKISLETKFSSPFGSRNFSSIDWYFSQIPLPNMIYLYKTIFVSEDMLKNRHQYFNTGMQICTTELKKLSPFKG
jgi:hypothetical protein